MVDSSTQQSKKWYEKTWYQILLFAVGISLFGLAMGLILDWYIAPRTPTDKKDLVQALGLITAGTAGAIGILFTWRGQRLAREAQEYSQRDSQEQLRLATEGQVTERFTKAIDQLGEEDDKGNPRLEIRIGAIYTLERIAKHYQEQSPEDYGPVMEVLTAYIRENAKRATHEAPGPTLQGDQLASSLEGKFYTSSARGDVQAALDVLGRRQDEVIPEEQYLSTCVGPISREQT
jgi:hypothetical protein